MSLTLHGSSTFALLFSPRVERPQQHIFSFRRLRTADLGESDRALVHAAGEAAQRAYAPYSNFLVGAAARMDDGSVVEGNNQENASFPAGICAERTALHAALSARPSARVETMAVMVPQVEGDEPVSPCGICRQALLEQESRQGAPLRVILATASGHAIVIERASDLLPLYFDRSFLKP
ncbi:MAG: cytidine deaminase [Flavobacteriales bacterium]|nr:cytidine deaminase [Flavobacteriales bacterium]